MKTLTINSKEITMNNAEFTISKEKNEKIRTNSIEDVPKNSQTSRATHFFVEQINNALIPVTHEPIIGKKIHTIRGNYELWSKRIKEVQQGEAVLCIRYWSGKPYNSKQVEFCVLDKDSGVGVQKLEFVNNIFHICIDGKWNCCDVKDLAKNDGLSFDDFCEWFKGYDLTEPMAIIHFTKFRY